MFRCLKPGCPIHCGTHRRPACAERVVCRALFLVLAGVLLMSLGIGLRSLNAAAARSASGAESPPLAGSEEIHLLCEAEDHARERVLRDSNGKPAMTADQTVQVAQ